MFSGSEGYLNIGMKHGVLNIKGPFKFKKDLKHPL